MSQQMYYKQEEKALVVTSQNLVGYEPLAEAKVSAINKLKLTFTKLVIKGPGYATQSTLYPFDFDQKIEGAAFEELHLESLAPIFSVDMGQYPRMKTVNLVNCRISAEDTRRFYINQPAMVTLKQERCVVDYLDFHGIKDLKLAQTLNFEGFIEVRAQGSGLDSLRYFTKGDALEIIDFSNTSVTVIDSIRALKYLRILRADGCQIKSLEGQPDFDLPNIYELSVSNCPLASLKGAAKLATLEVINCENVAAIKTFEDIVDLPLHAIHMRGTSIGNDQHDNIQQLRRLQELDLRGTPLAQTRDEHNISEDIENNPMLLTLANAPEALNPEQTQRLEHKMTVTEERRMLRDELVQLRRDILQQTAEIAAIKEREEFQKKEQERQTAYEEEMEKQVDKQLDYMKKMSDLLMQHFGDRQGAPDQE